MKLGGGCPKSKIYSSFIRNHSALENSSNLSHTYPDPEIPGPVCECPEVYAAFGQPLGPVSKAKLCKLTGVLRTASSRGCLFWSVADRPTIKLVELDIFDLDQTRARVGVLSTFIFRDRAS